MSYIEVNNQFAPAFYRFRFNKMAGKGPGKKLFSSLMENDESDILNDDTIKVFLRLKPPSNQEESSIVEVIDSRTVLFKMPPEYAQFKKKLNIPDEFKYTFSNIYRENATQADVFTGCVASLVKDLFCGQNCLLFTYGTTNAGKTFTVLGNGSHPGILPRTLTTVFKSIKGKEYGSARIKPDMFNSAMEMTDAMLEEEVNFKQKILSWNPEKTMSDGNRTNKTSSSSRPSADDYIGETVFREMQKRLTNDTSIVEYQADSQDRFSVWVSFGEIYNENIYDLLVPVNTNKKRKALKLAQDRYRNVYIKGLKHVFVQSEEEAYKVLMFGKNNLQVAATGMNSHSSRSHCIFSIKLIKIPNVENPERVVVSSFAICDLAGAERQKKTLNVGLRLKESQNINCSLHVLSRCFTVLRENQLHNKNELIPFRDSKLTQLFQHALMGKESVTMIVNVNQEKHLCEETQHVLKATAVAKHIVVQPRLAPKPPRLTRTSMFSQMISRHNRSTLIRWDSCVKPKVPEVLDLVEDSAASEHAPSQLEEKEERYESLLVLIENLKEKLQNEKTKHLETKKAARLQEDQIRREMCSKFDQLMKEAQANNENDKKRARQLVLDIAAKPVDKASPNFVPSKMPKIDEQELNENLPDVIKELSEEVKNQKLEIEALTDFVNTLRDEKKELTMELTSTKMDLGWKEQEIANLKNQIIIFGEEGGLKAAYVALQNEMEEKIKVRDRLLEEARSDLLDELSAKDDLEKEWVKLDKELVSKEEEIYNLQSQLKDRERENDLNLGMLEKITRELDYTEEERDELEKKCTTLEEEFSKKEDSILKLKCIEDSLKQELEALSSEKNDLEEKLATVTEEYKAFKETNDELEKCSKLEEELSEKVTTISKLQLQEDGLKKELEALTLERNGLQQDLASVTQEFKAFKEANDELLKKCARLEEELLKKNEMILQLQHEENDIKNKLERVLFEKNNLQLNLASVTQEYQTFKDEITPQLEEIQGLKAKELEMGQMLRQINQEKDDLSKEVSTLQQSLKHQIQETTKMMNLKLDKAKEVDQLLKDINKNKISTEELSKKLTHCENQVIALHTRNEIQKQELDECRKKDDSSSATIRNLEQEMVTFQSNQREIISKYEQQLKKTKEENEVLKGEVAKVTNTFNKLTPTPKKDLEKKNEELKKIIEVQKKELEDLQQLQRALRKEKDTLVNQLNDNANKENEDNVFVSSGQMLSEQSKAVTCQSTRLRAHSVKEVTKPRLEVEASRSASKLRARRTTRAANHIPVDIPDGDNDSKTSEKPVKPARRKLLDTTTQSMIDQFDNDDEEITIPQSSPGSAIQRCLRARHPK